MKTVTDNMRAVEISKLAEVMKQTALPIVVMFWNPIDLRYEEWRQQALRLTEEYADRVTVLSVELDRERSSWWELFRNGIPTPYVQKSLELPTLMIIRTEEERNCQPGAQPGFIDRRNFMPGMAHMFGSAASSVKRNEEATHGN